MNNILRFSLHFTVAYNRLKRLTIYVELENAFCLFEYLHLKVWQNLYLVRYYIEHFYSEPKKTYFFIVRTTKGMWVEEKKSSMKKVESKEQDRAAWLNIKRLRGYP